MPHQCLNKCKTGCDVPNGISAVIDGYSTSVVRRRDHRIFTVLFDYRRRSQLVACTHCALCQCREDVGSRKGLFLRVGGGLSQVFSTAHGPKRVEGGGQLDSTACGDSKGVSNPAGTCAHGRYG